MAWIESHQALGQHPKLKRLARLLNISLPAAVGHLHYLWWWCLDYAPDGDLSRYDAADIADAALWPADPEVFVKTLAQAGFLDNTDHGWRIHDWNDYAGRLVERRLAERERSRQRRLALRAGQPADDQRTTAGQPADDQRTTEQRPLAPKHTQQDQDRTLDLSVCVLYAARKNRPITTTESQTLQELEIKYGRELALAALEEAFARQKRPGVGYIRAILENWARDGITTVDEARQTGAGAAPREPTAAAPARADPDGGYDQFIRE